MKGAEKVCGTRKVGGLMRGTAWWKVEGVMDARNLKKHKYEKWLQEKSEETREEYKKATKDWRRVVRNAKKHVNDEWCGELLSDEQRVNERWSDYFESLLNVKDEREADVPCMGIVNGIRRERPVEQKELLDIKEVRMAIKKLKNGKATGVDDIAGEMIKAGGEVMAEWLVRVLNICWKEGRVPEDWRKAVIVPIYKGKGEKDVCNNYRGISLLSVVGKLYGRVLIERVKEKTERCLREEQCGFRQGRSCVDQIFTVNQVCEKYLDKNKSVYMAFMDLEKAYDRVDRKGVWRVLENYGIGGKLLKSLKSFYDGCSASVRVGRSLGKWFSVDVGLRQGCVMSPWLFNVYMDTVVREVGMRTLERGVRLDDWEMGQCLFADDTVLMADSEEKLQNVVNEFGVVCHKRKLKVNVGKSKVMKVSREGLQHINVSLNGERLEEKNVFRYLGVDIAANGRMTEEIKHRVTEGMKMIGGLKRIWKERGVSKDMKLEMYNRIVVPTVLYGHECWVMNAEARRKLNVVEMKALRAISGVSIWDRVRNEEVRRRCGENVRIEDKAESGILRWFGHVERMDEGRLAKKVYGATVGGYRHRGRPPCRWIDSVRTSLSKRNLSMEEGKMSVHDRKGWRRICKYI